MKVTYYKQETDYSCFPACIRMLLDYHDIKKEEKKLRLLFHSTPLKGGSWPRVKDGLKQLNIEFELGINFSLEELKSLIQHNIPVVASIDISFFGGDEHQNHTVVVTDVSNEFVTVHDPERGENIEIDVKQFSESWSERGRIAGYIKSK